MRPVLCTLLVVFWLLSLPAHAAQPRENRFLSEKKAEQVYNELSAVMTKDKKEDFSRVVFAFGDALLLPIMAAMKNAELLEKLYDRLEDDREKGLVKVLVRANLHTFYKDLQDKKKLFTDLAKTGSAESKKSAQSLLRVTDKIIALYDGLEKKIQQYFPSKQEGADSPSKNKRQTPRSPASKKQS